YFFFFQAEDGIRDFHVTGVQTCALPIWLVDPEIEDPELGVAGQLPAAVEQRAAAGVGQGAAEGLVLDEQLVGAHLRFGQPGRGLGLGSGLQRLARARRGLVRLQRPRRAAPGQVVVAGQPRGGGLDRGAAGQAGVDILLRQRRHRGRGQGEQGGGAGVERAGHGADPGSSRLVPASAASWAWASCSSMSRLTEVSASAACVGSWCAAGPSSAASRAMRRWYTVRGGSMPARAKAPLTRRMDSLRTLPRSL